MDVAVRVGGQEPGAIGGSNFHPDRLVDLIDHNEITPAVNQIETHPFHQRTADQALMRERGVQIESWEPFAESRNNLFTDPTLSQIADAHGTSVAQVVLRWLVQREVVVIPKSVRPHRVGPAAAEPADHGGGRGGRRRGSIGRALAAMQFARPPRTNGAERHAAVVWQARTRR